MSPIVCICGSTRFRSEICDANRRLTLSGWIVLAPGVFAHDGDEITEAQKVQLDRLHLAKIDLAEKVLVVNPGGYIGESTRREIEYAQQTGTPVAYTHSTKPPVAPPMTDDDDDYVRTRAVLVLVQEAIHHTISGGSDTLKLESDVVGFVRRELKRPRTPQTRESGPEWALWRLLEQVGTAIRLAELRGGGYIVVDTLPAAEIRHTLNAYPARRQAPLEFPDAPQIASHSPYSGGLDGPRLTL